MPTPRTCTCAVSLLLAAVLGTLLGLAVAAAEPAATPCWDVADVQPGMKGEGLTVIQGTRIDKFAAEVLGVLKNTSPGRDMILARLSGCNLEKTGVIAGMSGSPVYIEGKLLGAVAFAWSFGKEPIAGITPFCQMKSYAEALERRESIISEDAQQIGLHRPISLGERDYAHVTISHKFTEAVPTAADGLWLQPLRTPLSATGFSAPSLALLAEKLHGAGLVPMQGGGVSGAVAEKAKDVPLQAGGALSVALVTGDFDLSGIGTVTHIEGKRVYGWGHPFLGLGGCEFPLMTGYVHAIYPRQNLSFKMGSPLRTVGVINADVSTCIAGWLDREPDMLPVRMTVNREPGEQTRTFRVKVVRQRALLPNLVFTCLTNSVDMAGELPEELTADMKAVIHIQGREPIVLADTFSGAHYAGGRAARAMYGQVASVLNALVNNELKPLRIEKIDCTTHIRTGRRSAEIDAVELDSAVYEPGEILKAHVFLRPHHGGRQRLTLQLPLPADMPEGDYQARIMDDVARAERQLRENPHLGHPQTLDQLFEALRMQTTARHTYLALEVPREDVGVALPGQALPDLPASMVHILANGRRTGGQTISSALIARQPADWVITGSETVRFRVSRNKRISTAD